MDEFDFLNQQTAENRRIKAAQDAEARRINSAKEAFRMITDLICLAIVTAALVLLAYTGQISVWLAACLVLADTACVFFRLGRFVGQ